MSSFPAIYCTKTTSFVTNVHNILTQVSTVHMELDYTLLFLCTTSKTRTRTRTLPKWRADSYTHWSVGDL